MLDHLDLLPHPYFNPSIHASTQWALPHLELVGWSFQLLFPIYEHANPHAQNDSFLFTLRSFYATSVNQGKVAPFSPATKLLLQLNVPNTVKLPTATQHLFNSSYQGKVTTFPPILLSCLHNELSIAPSPKVLKASLPPHKEWSNSWFASNKREHSSCQCYGHTWCLTCALCTNTSKLTSLLIACNPTLPITLQSNDGHIFP